MDFSAAFLMLLCLMETPNAFNFQPSNHVSSYFSGKKPMKVKIPANVEQKSGKVEKLNDVIKSLQTERKSLLDKVEKTASALQKQCNESDLMTSLLLELKEKDLDKLKFKDAYISSNWAKHSKAKNVIDGNKLAQFYKGSCVHSSGGDHSPWLLLALEKESIIHRVDLTTRQDCCWQHNSNLRVEVLDTDPREDQDAVPKLCALFRNSTDPIVRIACQHPVIGKYIRIQKYQGQVLQACEIEAFGHVFTNEFGRAIQSSKLDNAKLATDGDPKTCSETENEANRDSWWQVDLMKTRNLTGLMITNRDDEKYSLLSNFDVLVYETFQSVCLTTNQTVCAVHKDTVGQGQIVTLTCNEPMRGRYMRIRKLGGGTLSLCDVRLLYT